MKDYEKAYKEALERARRINNGDGIPAPPDYTTCEAIFPELRESEDEKIRKGIIEYLEQSQFGEEHYLIDDDIVRGYIAWLEKQGEQKSADKDEPKFKVGDWITNGACIIKITSIDDRYYWHDNDCVGGDIESIDKEYHLWTIDDAKDGDVLVHNGCTFIFMGIKNGIVQAIEENLLDDTNPVCFGKPDEDGDYHPATKEQRDLLFQKIKEAGYEWDDEKKELRKIEKESIWSEEDEEKLNSIIQVLGDNSLLVQWLKSLKDRVQLHPKQEWSEEDEFWLKEVERCVRVEYPLKDSKIIDWLKSLRPNHWKPSKEQMEALNAINNVGELSYVGQADLLIKLYNDLEKL